MSDDGLRCVAIIITTAAIVEACGALAPMPFLVEFRLAGGTTELVYVKNLARVAELVHEFSPREICVRAERDEEVTIRAALGVAVAGVDLAAPPTIH